MNLVILTILIVIIMLIAMSIIMWNGKSIRLDRSALYEKHIEHDPDETPVIEKTTLEKHLSMIEKDS